jgi:hypothetical protein
MDTYDVIVVQKRATTYRVTGHDFTTIPGWLVLYTHDERVLYLPRESIQSVSLPFIPASTEGGTGDAP